MKSRKAFLEIAYFLEIVNSSVEGFSPGYFVAILPKCLCPAKPAGLGAEEGQVSQPMVFSGQVDVIELKNNSGWRK